MPLNLNHIQALCFDIDGTLRDTDDQAVQSLTKALKPISILFPERDPGPFARRFIMSSENLGNYLIGLPDRLDFDHHIERLLSRFERRKRNNKPKTSLIIPGIQQMLAQLHTRYPMAVVSAGRRSAVNAFLEQYELTSYFQCVATAQTCRRTKPYPDPIMWSAEKMGVSPGSCAMIGDTTVDIRAGKAAGTQTVGVLCGFGEEEELLSAGADLILKTTAELSEILLK